MQLRTQRVLSSGRCSRHSAARCTHYTITKAAPSHLIDHTWTAIERLHDQIDALGACYMFTGAAAAYAQGADVPSQLLMQQQISVSLQWDFLEQLHSQLAQQQQPGPAQIIPCPGGRAFTLSVHGHPAILSCELNTVVQMNPNRVFIHHRGRQIWCESLLAVRDRAAAAADVQLQELANRRLQQLQQELTADNALVWSRAEATDAWQNKVGSPSEAAEWILQDPVLRLGIPLAKHLPQQLSGLRLINLMGSHGTKAVAAALLGAQVTCVDISPANAEYGQQLAAAAGADVRFVVCDVLGLPDSEHNGYDVVLLELGVLHYFVDLLPLMLKVKHLLQPGGRLILREFHPISTKLITSKGKKHKVAGNYFSQALVESEVAYSKYASVGSSAAADAKPAGVVRLRQWALGEVVSSVAAAGLMVQVLQEEPGVKLADAGLPKLFTLVACKL